MTPTRRFTWKQQQDTDTKGGRGVPRVLLATALLLKFSFQVNSVLRQWGSERLGMNYQREVKKIELAFNLFKILRRSYSHCTCYAFQTNQNHLFRSAMFCNSPIRKVEEVRSQSNRWCITYPLLSCHELRRKWQDPRGALVWPYSTSCTTLPEWILRIRKNQRLLRANSFVHTTKLWQKCDYLSRILTWYLFVVHGKLLYGLLRGQLLLPFPYVTSTICANAAISVYADFC